MSDILVTLPPLTRALPQIRAAYAAKSLQAQNGKMNIGGCSYQGPCAIGVLLPEAIRKRFDNIDDPNSIHHLYIDGHVEFAEGDDDLDWSLLQDAHDHWAIARPDDRADREEHFVKVLYNLEENYNVHVA